jgi:hypothetical protein
LAKPLRTRILGWPSLTDGRVNQEGFSLPKYRKSIGTLGGQ